MSPQEIKILDAFDNKNANGEYTTVFAVSEAYFDKDGFVRDMDRVSIDRLSDAPAIFYEEIHVSEDPDDDTWLISEHISYDKGGIPDIETCREDRRFSLLEPGEYVSLCFEFTKYQDRIAARLFNSLEDHYLELEEIERKETFDSAQVPVLSIIVVPLSLGGKGTLRMIEPTIWPMMENTDVQDSINSSGYTLLIIAPKENVRFFYDETLDTDELISRCKSELVSEWIRQDHVRSAKSNAAAYQKLREEERAKRVQITSRHTFRASKSKEHV